MNETQCSNTPNTFPCASCQLTEVREQGQVCVDCFNENEAKAASKPNGKTNGHAKYSPDRICKIAGCGKPAKLGADGCSKEHCQQYTTEANAKSVAQAEAEGVKFVDATGVPESNHTRRERIKGAAKKALKDLGADDLGLIFKTPKVEPQTPRPYVIAPLEGQIDGWFPLGEVSLVGAASGASKTTLIYQMLLAQERKERFFGHETFGRSSVVFAVDRGKAAHDKTMERMRLKPESIRFGRMPMAFDTEAVQVVINSIEAMQSRPEIVVIEGIDMLVSEISEIKCIAQFMASLDRVAKHFNIAVIGTLGSPKIKAGQGYTAKRDNMLGSSAWGRLAETIINIQYPKNDDTDTRRIMFVLLRNAPAEKYTLTFEGGKLVETEEIDENTSTGQAMLELRWFEDMAKDAEKDPTKEWFTALDMARFFGMGESTARRHCQDAFTKKIIRMRPGPKISDGGRPAKEYQWNTSPTNPILAGREREQEEIFDQAVGTI
jgi:AAA domain